MITIIKDAIKVTILSGFVLLSAYVAVAAWSEPSTAPTGGNASAPLDVSATGQTKAGGLILNTGGATNGLLVSLGNVGIGTESPAGVFHIKTVQNDTNQSLMISSHANLSDGIVLNSINDGNTANKGMEFRASSFDFTGGANQGQVGISTSSPSQMLSVNGTIYSNTGYRFPDGTTQTTAPTKGGSSIVESGTSVNYFSSPVTTSRSCGTVYTNNTSSPIYVAATAWSLSNGNVPAGFYVYLGTPSAPTTPSYVVQYSVGVSNAGGAPAVSAFFIVPPGYAYQINVASGYGACPSTWTEYQ